MYHSSNQYLPFIVILYIQQFLIYRMHFIDNIISIYIYAFPTKKRSRTPIPLRFSLSFSALSLDLHQRDGQLIRTGRAAAALNALETLDGFVHLHALGQTGNALRVAGAAADEINRLDGIARYLDLNGTGAGSLGLINVHQYLPPLYESQFIVSYIPSSGKHNLGYL